MMTDYLSWMVHSTIIMKLIKIKLRLHRTASNTSDIIPANRTIFKYLTDTLPFWRQHIGIEYSIQ